MDIKMPTHEKKKQEYYSLQRKVELAPQTNYVGTTYYYMKTFFSWKKRYILEVARAKYTHHAWRTLRPKIAAVGASKGPAVQW